MGRGHLGQCYLTGGTRTLRSIRENSRGYVNTDEMSSFLFLYPFCTVISTMTSLLPIDTFFQTTSYSYIV
jgi:hypothetical protein